MAITQAQIMPKEVEPAATSMMGHNQPPLEVLAKDEFETEYRKNLKEADVTDQRRLDLIASADRAEITSEESFTKGATLISQIRAFQKIIKNTHTTVKAPYLTAGRVVDAEMKARLQKLDDAQSAVESKQMAYVTKRENDRREREREAERKAAQAEQERREREAQAEKERLAAIEAGKPAPPPPPPEPEPVRVASPSSLIGGGPMRSAEGSTVSAKIIKVPVVIDYLAAFPIVQSNEKVREAIDKAIAALVKAGMKEIAGVEMRDQPKVTNR